MLLDSTRAIDRARFVGGPGSGKTWLTVEKAKRLAKGGQRVGLFCYNKGLGEHLRRQVAGWRQAKPVFVGEFHEYVRSLGVPDGVGQDYLDKDMPELLAYTAGNMAIEDKLDAVGVDEAQDFAPLWWEALLACLKSPPTAACTRSWMSGRTSTAGGMLPPPLPALTRPPAW